VTAWPTLTPLPTATSLLPQPTPTLTGVPAPTATRLPAPVLLQPLEGQVFGRQDEINLHWKPVGQPGTDVYYAISVSYSHAGETWHDETPWITDTVWLMSQHLYLLHLSDDGHFCWAVQAMRRLDVDPAGTPVGEALSPPSARRCFIWYADEATGPTATPTPSPTPTKEFPPP
jgi:hypothetical protein